MNAIVTKPAVTPDDMLRLPDEGKGYELVSGRLEEPGVSAKSSRVGGRVYRLLETHCETRQPGWAFPADAAYRCFSEDPNRIRRPDAAFIAFDRFTEQEYDAAGYIPVCPDLIVEVISPNDLANDLNEKLDEWLVAGAKTIWLIDPELKSVDVYQAGKSSITRLRESDILAGDPVLPGFSCPVADLFRLPAAAQPT
jgi:Uma2 family endonuclease